MAEDLVGYEVCIWFGLEAEGKSPGAGILGWHDASLFMLIVHGNTLRSLALAASRIHRMIYRRAQPHCRTDKPAEDILRTHVLGQSQVWPGMKIKVKLLTELT